MIHEELAALIARLEEARMRYSFELSELPEGTLASAAYRSGIRYYHRLKANGKPTKKSITRNNELVKQLSRKEYLTHALPIIEHDLSELKKRYRNIANATQTEL